MAGYGANGTLRRALRAAERELVASGVEGAAFDARVLLRHVLNLSAPELYLQLDRAMTAEQATTYAGLIRQRARHEPVAYLTGRREFYCLDLHVTPDVLIPQPDTEVLVERAVAALPSGSLVADVGTGSGAIAVAVASVRPDVRLLAVDRSLAACRVARGNVVALGLAGRVGVVCADLLTAVPGPLDAVVANLPYLTRLELTALDQEVRQEPLSALDGGADGLDLYRRLVDALAQRDPSPALVLCEIAPTQAAALQSLLATALPDHTTAIHADLAGRQRVVEARLTNP